MRYVVASDHAGFPLKEAVRREIEALGHEARDLGVQSADRPADYPDAARLVGEALMRGEAERGVLLCGSGVGASIAANKLPGIRCAICHDTFSAHQGVEDDNMNVLALGARIIGPELALDIVRAFANASFSGAERHVRRLEKLIALEQQYSCMTEVHVG